MAEILIVEDYPPIASLLSRLLRSLGHQVTRELCVAGALRHNCAFDDAVLDIDLPDGDGVSLAELLLASNRVANVVFFTGTRDALLLARAAKLGLVVDKSSGTQPLLAALRQQPHTSGLHCRGFASEGAPASQVLELDLDVNSTLPSRASVSRCL